MDRDSIIGIVLLIIIALIAVNYFHPDCSAIMEKGKSVRQGFEDPERKVGKTYNLPPPSIESAPATLPGTKQDGKPDGHEPQVPPEPTIPPGP